MDPLEFHGLAMSAYFGGRAEVRVRRSAVPIVHTDFVSMYPTVMIHLGIWDFFRADRLEIVDVTDHVRSLVDGLSADDIYQAGLWEQFAFLAEIEPCDDILPVRARYDGRNRNIGVNYLTSDRPIWIAGPDIIGSTILTGRPPKIRRALALRAHGLRSGLKPIEFGSRITIDPASENFFRRVIELRKSLDRWGLEPKERKRLDRALKIIANSAYGIFAEMHVEKRQVAKDVQAYGLRPFESSTRWNEKVGPFTFPFYAALATSGARLMLALLEYELSELGGIHALADTDSMAIVSTRKGGRIDIEGEEKHALSWKEVESIRAKFENLNPYDQEIIRGSILELEDENFDNVSNQRIQLYAWAISAKRYCLFREIDGQRVIVWNSEHGLGHLMNPIDLSAERRDWTRQGWEDLLAREFEEDPPTPAWMSRPALTKISATTPSMLLPFKEFNSGREYADQVRPMNFLSSANVRSMGHPEGFDPNRFHLIAEYEANPSRWTELRWIERHTGSEVAVTTTDYANPYVARLKTYRGVLESYAVRPEYKSADRNGKPCRRVTKGILRRRRVRVSLIEYTGKEAHRWGDAEQGIIQNPDEIFIAYGSDGYEWEQVLSRLHDLPAKQLAEAAGVTPRYVKMIRNRHANPSQRVKALIARYVRRSDARRRDEPT